MLSKEEIFEWVTQTLEREFQLSAQDLRPAAHLADDLDLDSIDAVDLSIHVEEKFDLALSEEGLKSIETIQDVVNLIHERL